LTFYQRHTQSKLLFDKIEKIIILESILFTKKNMNNPTLINNLRYVPDFPIKGINFRDVTTLYKNPECLKIIEEEIYELYKDK
jgi:hypothetical protein